MRFSRLTVPVLVTIAALLAGGICVQAGESAKININTASVEELTQLHGVGPKYAARIVAYREQKGLFASAEDLMKVPGIGPKTFEKNKDLIVVE